MNRFILPLIAVLAYISGSALEVATLCAQTTSNEASTLFNVNPIRISPAGLDENETAYCAVLEDVVNAVCHATTLGEIMDVWSVGRGKHFLSHDEYQRLKDADPQRLAVETNGAVESYDDYFIVRNRASAVLFGKIEPFRRDPSCFIGLVLKSRNAIGDVLVLINTNGYIELRLATAPDGERKTAREIRIVKYEQSDGTIFQFYPSGLCQRRLSCRYLTPKDLCVLNSAVADIPKSNENDNFLFERLRHEALNANNDECEIVGEIVEWEENGRNAKRTTLSAPRPYADFAIPYATRDASVDNIGAALAAAPLFRVGTFVVPKQGLDDEYAKSGVEELAKSLASFGETDSNRAARLNALADALYGADARFDAFAWTWTSRYSHSVKFIGSKGCAEINFYENGVRSLDDLQKSRLLDGVLKKLKLSFYGQKDELTFGFHRNGALKNCCWYEYEFENFCETEVHIGCPKRTEALGDRRDIESEKDFGDKLDALLYPKFKMKFDFEWNADGDVVKSEKLNEPIPLSQTNQK